MDKVSDCALCLLDTQGNISAWTPCAEAFSGYMAQEVLGRHFSIFYAPAERDAGLPGKALQDAITKGRLKEEGVRQNKNGESCWVEVIIDPLSPAEGGQAGFSYVMNRIVPVDGAQLALAESEERFRILVEGVRDYAIYMLDAHGNITSWNTGAQAIKGYASDEVVGCHFSMFYTDEDRAFGMPDKALATAVANGKFQGEAERVRKTGERFWASVVIDPIYDSAGGLIGFAKVTQDITERRNAQAELDQSRAELAKARELESVRKLTQALAAETERLNFAQSVAGVGSWETDLTNYAVTWSSATYEIFGLSEADFDGTHSDFIRRVHPEDQERVNDAFAASLQGKDTIYAVDHRVVTLDGATKTVTERWKILRGPDGRPSVVQGTVQDISERIMLEDRLRQSQKLEAIGQLTGGIAHDFNNLLTIILANAELLSDQLNDDQQLRLLADMTATAAERGAELTHQLLSFARRQALEPKIVNVNRLVAGMDALLRRTIPEDIDIEVVSAGGLWNAELDPAQLEAALLNLAVNASHAMPDGGHLTIETANVKLDDGYAEDHIGVAAGQYVMVGVSDSGTGMTNSVREQAFEPFFTTKEVGKGTGLGLSMVYGFVKQSNGHAKIYSEVGQGTTVKLYFPRIIASSSEISIKDSSPVLGGTEHILVVEDDDMVRQNAVTQLKLLGYRVTEASDASQALKALEAQPDIDLLFTDVVMPGAMNGKALATAARALNPCIKVLFTSGYTENAIVHHGRLDAGESLLSKPYRRRIMAAKVRSVLSLKRSGS